MAKFHDGNHDRAAGIRSARTQRLEGLGKARPISVLAIDPFSLSNCVPPNGNPTPAIAPFRAVSPGQALRTWQYYLLAEDVAVGYAPRVTHIAYRVGASWDSCIALPVSHCPTMV